MTNETGNHATPEPPAGDDSIDNIQEPEIDAPTMDALDAEVQREMAEALGGASVMDLVDAEEMAAKTERDQIQRGKVIAIQGDDIFVDVGAKSEGYLPATQFKDDPLPAVGDVIEVVIEGFDRDDNLLKLSREGAVMQAAWDDVQRGQVLEGIVKGHNKGGLEMEFSGIRGFMPASQIDRHRVEEMSGYVNQKMQCEVIEIKRDNKSIVVSRRNILQREAAEAKEKMYGSIAEGQTTTGVVKTIMPYGAFVDIGGVDGLLHVSDMAHSRVNDPNEVVKEGQQLELMVLKVDHENKKISLGLKQVMPDPWTGADNKWQPDTVVSGRIVKLMDFGAFVQLEEGVEGLIPISEMSYERRINHPKEVVTEGEVVKVRVLNVEPERKRISLSIKRLAEDPWMGASHRWPAGSVVNGTVKRLEGFGAFVELAPGIEGLVHISELSYNRVGTVGEVVAEGQVIEAKVLSVDEDKRRIGLSIKQRVEMPDYTGDADTQSSEPAAPPKKRKKPLRGGLDR